MKRSKQVILLTAVLVLGLGAASRAQILKEYIEYGLKNNLVLQQKEIHYQKANAALSIAKSYFQPALTLLADYTSGEGGRAISIPVGDMLNPVYATLNQLTASKMFPQIANVTEDFFPYKFYDVKLRAAMPLLNTDIIYNSNIKELESQIQKQEIDKYRRELIREITVAYYGLMSAVLEERIYGSAKNVAEEAKRVNESALRNGAGLPVYVLRSESEIMQLEAKMNETRGTAAVARKFFNFLLNRNPDEEVMLDESADITEAVRLAAKGQGRRGEREEIAQLSLAVNIHESLAAMQKSAWFPKVNAFADLGTQDMIWEMKKESKYYLFGIQLELPLYEGFRTTAKIEEARLDVKARELELALGRRRFDLLESKARTELSSALEHYESAKKQAETARSYYALITKGYKEGVHTFLESLDARTQLTQSEILVTIKKYAVLIAYADFARESAAEDITFYTEK